MRKAMVAIGFALTLAIGAAGVAAALSDEPPPRAQPDRPSVPTWNSPDTTVPRGGAPEIPGKPNRDRVPNHTGREMTHTTGTVVTFR